MLDAVLAYRVENRVREAQVQVAEKEDAMGILAQDTDGVISCSH